MNKEMADMIMPVFIERSFESVDASGSVRIPDQARQQLKGVFNLEDGVVAAMCYLAERTTEDELFKLELDTTSFSGDTI